MQIPVCPEVTSSSARRWQNEASPQIQIREPSSRGGLGAMIIGIALMPPANDLLMMLGIAFCALSNRTERVGGLIFRGAGLNNRDADRAWLPHQAVTA